MKRPIFFLAILALLTSPKPSLAVEFNPNYILSDAELKNPFALDLNQIQHFLKRGYLANYITEDHLGVRRYAADIIWRTAQNVGINPKFLLVLLQKEQSLVEDDDPTQSQLDWATGYAVCDSCAKNDPAIQRWKGFGKQVNSAALQYIEGYMDDIESNGTTQGKYGPGVPVDIDGTTVIPENAATASMYAYTPHLHGNENFVKIWSRWFQTQHPSGTLLKAHDSPGVYLIEDGYKRPIKSWSTLVSRFNPNNIIEVDQSQLANYPDGSSITFPNYSLLRDEAGRIALLVDDAIRYIDSMETFRAIGFVEDQINEVTTAELAGYKVSTPITAATLNPVGSLYKIPSGAVFYVQDGVRHVVLSDEILKAKFAHQTPQPVDSVVVEQYREGTPVLLPDGYLLKSPDEATVYIMSDGEKRAIPSETAFLAYGWAWDDILTVPASVLKLHPTGLPLEEPQYLSE